MFVLIDDWPAFISIILLTTQNSVFVEMLLVLFFRYICVHKSYYSKHGYDADNINN